jgi:hypothetical protein
MTPRNIPLRRFHVIVFFLIAVSRLPGAHAGLARPVPYVPGKGPLAAAKETVRRMSRTQSMAELIDLSSNETAFALANMMNLVLQLRARGGVGPSTAEISKPDPALQKDIESLWHQYAGATSSQSPSDRDAKLSSLRQQGRRIATDFNIITMRAAKRHSFIPDSLINLLKPAVNPRSYRFEIVNPTCVRLVPEIQGRPYYDVKVEQGYWRFHNPGTIRAVNNDMHLKRSSNPLP